ncbi:hypothetical protein DNTS_025345 [Danionella cerebrum]|uniref:RQC domain-containing protein n=1 Tax=Danionella cerebrum TaxID=2873325 RepID=A0A553NMH6_9TELE|nr:hypothetical protein DNTS_025345 [Danionella translucida]
MQLGMSPSYLFNGTFTECNIFSDYITLDITQHARDVVQIVELATAASEKLTPLKVCDAWMGKGPAKQRKMINITSLTRLEVESIIIHLLLHGYFSEDFSFTPYTTHFYLKLGRKAALLKNSSHSITMKMKRTVMSHNTDVQAINLQEDEETSQIEHSSMDIQEQNKSKIHKNKQNIEKRLSQTYTDEEKPATVLEVDVEVNLIEDQKCDEDKLETSEVSEQQRSAMKRRPKQVFARSCAVDSVQVKAGMVHSTSEHSIISAAAVEELHHLRSYYSKQLRRINYISHEHLQSSQPGVLTCMTEPFKSLHFPSRTTIARGARSLWTRVSMRRKLIQ